MHAPLRVFETLSTYTPFSFIEPFDVLYVVLYLPSITVTTVQLLVLPVVLLLLHGG